MSRSRASRATVLLWYFVAGLVYGFLLDQISIEAAAQASKLGAHAHTQGLVPVTRQTFVGQLGGCAALRLQRWISPTGHDGGNGATCRPFATLAGAATYVRSHNLNAGLSANLVLKLKTGDYWTSSTTTLTDADSGSNGFSVDYLCAGSPGSCRILGGQKLTGCSVWSGAIWRCPLSGQVSTLYENGVRAIMARTPNLVITPRYPTARANYLTNVGVSGSYTQIQYNPGDITPGSWSLAGAQVVVWPGGGNRAWFTDTIPISSINDTTHIITLADNTLYTNESGERYFIQGVLALLDQPGEFYDDVAGGYVYYQPRCGCDPGTVEMVAPTVSTVLAIAGTDNTHRASHLIFDGLTFQYSDFAPYASSSSLDQGKGLVSLVSADNVTLQNVHLTDAGFSGITMSQYNQGHTFQRLQIDNVGDYGILARNYFPISSSGDVLRGNTFSDLQIDYFGQLVGQGNGVFLFNSGHNTLTNFNISHGPRSAIQVSVAVGESPSNVFAVGNTISDGQFWSVNEESGDIGGIYTSGLADGLTTSPPYPYNTYSNVFGRSIHAHPSMLDAAPNVAFADDWAPGQVWTNFQGFSQNDQLYRVATSATSCCQLTTNVNCTSGTFNGCSGTFVPGSMGYGSIGITSQFPFSRTSVTLYPSLYADLNADALAGSDGSLVSTWSNQSVNGTTGDFTQATMSHQPALKLNRLNGHRSVEFDGVNDALDNSGFTMPSTGWTVATVFQLPNGAISVYSAYLWILHGQYAKTQLIKNVSPYPAVFFVANANANTMVEASGSNVTLDANPHILIVTFNGGTAGSTASYTVTWDGASQTVVDSTLQTDGPSSYPNELATGNGSDPFPVDVTRHMIFGAPLIPSDVAWLNSYLKSTYGL